jgi:hypothetical protein
MPLATHFQFALDLSNALGALFPTPPRPKALYHYTSTDGCLQIANTGTLRASDVRYLNDTGEMEHGREVLMGTLAMYKQRATYSLFMEAFESQNMRSSCVFATSFSTDPDLLSQWRAYAEDGAGFAIGFAPSALTGTAPNEWKTAAFESVLVPILYKEEDQETFATNLVHKTFEMLEAAPPAARDSAAIGMGFSIVFPAFMSMCKNSGFIEEAEWRVIHRFIGSPALMNATIVHPKSTFRVTRRGLTPYLTVPFPSEGGITEMICGPKQDPATSTALTQAMLSNSSVKDWPKVEIDHSSVTYR